MFAYYLTYRMNLPANVILFPGFNPFVTAESPAASFAVEVPVTARVRTRPEVAAPAPAITALETRVLSAEQAEETAKAKTLHAILAKIDPAKVAVVTGERMSRKPLAKAARALFSKLGIKGVSVTAPNYSMAQSVHVSPAERADYTYTNAARWDVAEGDAARAANNEARKKIEAILLAAFPGTDDRSDTQSDYFDYCWSVR